MDIMALRELCDECLRIEEEMRRPDLGQHQRGELVLQRAVTLKAIYDQVDSGRQLFPPEIS